MESQQLFQVVDMPVNIGHHKLLSISLQTSKLCENPLAVCLKLMPMSGESGTEDDMM